MGRVGGPVCILHRSGNLKGPSHMRCALLRGASKNARSVLPAPRDNAQRVNATTEIQGGSKKVPQTHDHNSVKS